MCMLSVMRRDAKNRAGLTLIELVVVLAVLAAVAALVIPRLDFLKTQADHAAAASNDAELASLLQVHKTSTGSYPTLDLLVDGTGAVYSKIWSYNGQSSGLPFSVTTITGPGAPGTSDWYRSLLEGGLKTGYQQEAAATDASNSTSASTATVDLVTQAAGGSLKVAEVNSAGIYNSALIKACYPGTGVVPANAKLIGLGIGPRNTMVGGTMINAPLETQGDDSTQNYCRYIAIFAIYADGRAAELKAVVDHRMKTLDKRLDQYRTSAPGA